MGKALEEKPCEGRLRGLCLPWRRPRGDLTVVFNTLTRGSAGAGTDLISSDQRQKSRKWHKAESGEI